MNAEDCVFDAECVINYQLSSVNSFTIYPRHCLSLHEGNHQGYMWQLVAAEHYDDVIMGAMASQITSLTIVYSTVYSGADQRKHQSSVSLAFVRGIHRGPVNSPHRWPVTRKMSPIDDVIIKRLLRYFTLMNHGPTQRLPETKNQPSFTNETLEYGSHFTGVCHKDVVELFSKQSEEIKTAKHMLPCN